MLDFEYKRVSSLQELTTVLSSQEGTVKILSGGTDLLPQLKEDLVNADVIIDIKGIPSICEIKVSDTSLDLGAAVTCMETRNHKLMQLEYPGLLDAFSIIGGIQIQGRASIGGNVCNASPAADASPALIAHEAMCCINGKNGPRVIPIVEFFVGPGKNILDVGEFLEKIKIPRRKTGFGASYMRFTPRNEMDIAVVGVGSSVKLNKNYSINSATIALGAVAPTPILIEEAGNSLIGLSCDGEIDESRLETAGEIAMNACSPLTDMRGSKEQRKHLVKVHVKRTLLKAIERAKNTMEE